MRKRNRSVLLRLTEEENNLLNERIAATGQSIQTYMLQVALGTTITSSDDKTNLIKLNVSLGEIDKRLRSMEEDLKRSVNASNTDELEKISGCLRELKREVTNIWQSLRQAISQR